MDDSSLYVSRVLVSGFGNSFHGTADAPVRCSWLPDIRATGWETGVNPPLDVDGNFLIGPEYLPAPERKVVEGVPQGKVEQFTIDSKDTKLFNPGIARKVFGKVDPKNPKTLIVETHEIDYKRQITVYIPAQYVPGSEAPFMVCHDGPRAAPTCCCRIFSTT